MAKTKYHFKIRDHVGLDPKGNPQPAVAVGLALAVPTMVDGEPINLEQSVQVDPLPDSRFFVTDDPLVADGLRALPSLEEVDEPTKPELAASVKATQPSRDAAGKHLDPEDPTAEPAAPATPNTEEA